MVRPYWAENPDVKPKVESEAEPPLSLLSISKYCNSLHRSADPYSDTHSTSAGESHVRSLSRRGGALFHPVKLGKKLTLSDILQIPDDFREFSDHLVSGIEPSLPETDFNFLGVVTKPPPLVASASWDELNATRQCLSAPFHSPQQTAVERTPDPLVQKKTTAEMLSNIVLPSSPSFDELITDTVMSTLLATADRETMALASKKRCRSERGVICDWKHGKVPTDVDVERESETRNASVTEDTGATGTVARKEKRRGKKVFQAYQESQWKEKFSEMCEYQHKFGHCIVPYTYAENPTLVRWVKRQRYQYKLRAQGMKNSTMTLDRITALENIGFVWDSQGASWMERWQELKAFKAAFGHCNVPSNYRNNKCLATWIKGQRKSDLRLLLLKLRTCGFQRFILVSLFLSFQVDNTDFCRKASRPT
jgi:Helicase associated domain